MCADPDSFSRHGETHKSSPTNGGVSQEDDEAWVEAGAFTTGGLELVDAYYAAHPGVPAPCVTTKTDGFAGNLDYIFTGPGIQQSGQLELPLDARVDGGESFEFVPSKNYASDHLAIGMSFK